MGMTTEDIIQGLRETYMICRSVYAYDRKKYIDGAIDRLNKYQMMKADYENRLKADMAAMLEDLDLQIDEFDPGCGWAGYIKKIDVHGLIQQKINELKGDQEGKNE